MSAIIRIIFVLVSIIGVCSGEMVTDTIADFEGGRVRVEPRSREKGVLVSTGMITGDKAITGKQSFAVSFKHEKGFADYNLPQLTENYMIDTAGKMSLAVFSTVDGMWLKVRFVDAKGETFQSKRITPVTGAWSPATVAVTEADMEVAWGGNNDKKIDYPLSPATILVEGIGEGVIYIDDIKYSFEQVPFTLNTSTERIVADFETPAAAAFTPGIEERLKSAVKKAEIGISGEAAHSGSKSLRVAFSYYPKAYVDVPVRDVLAKTPITEAGGVSVRAMSSAKDVWIKLRFIDASGETFQSTRLTLGGGEWRQKTIQLAEMTKEDFEDAWGGDKNRKIDLPAKLDRIVVEGTGDGVVYIDDIAYQSADHAALLAALAKAGDIALMNANKDLYYWYQGEPCSFAFQYRNRIRMDMPVTIEIDVRDVFNNSVYRKEKTLAFAAREKKNLPLSFDTATGTGVYYCTASARTTNGLPIARTAFSFAVLAGKNIARAKQDDILYGVCAHYRGTTNADETNKPYWRILDMLGVDAVRIDFSWSWLEPKKGEFNFDVYNSLVDNHRKLNMTMLPILDYFVRWIYPADADMEKMKNVPPADLSPFYTYVEKTIGVFKNRLPVWEVWNEPDLTGFWNGTPEKFIELYLESQKRIKKIDPSLKVITPGWAFAFDERMGKIEKFLAAADGKYEVFNFHSYDTIGALKRKHDKVDEWYARYKMPKTVPRWLTEFGYATQAGRSERTQAEQIIKMMAFAQAMNYKAFFVYDYINDGVDPTYNEHNFGLIRNNWREPKPAFAAYHSFIRTMRGFTAKDAPVLGENLSCYVFGKGEDEIAVVWQEVPGEKTLYLSAGNVRDVSAMDMMGNAQKISVVGGRIAVPFSETPLYLKWKRTDGSKVTGAFPLMNAPQFVALADGKPVTSPVTVFNPFDAAFNGTLSLTSVGAFPGTITPAARSLNIAAGKSATAEFEVRTMKSGARNDNLKVSLAADGRELGSASIAVKYVLGIASKQGVAVDGVASEWTGAPVVELSTAQDVKELFAFDPNRPDMKWKGKTDHSASGYFSYDTANYYLAVIVNDNIHEQKEKPEDLWKADSLQFGISPDGETNMVIYDIALVGGAPVIYRRDGLVMGTTWGTPKPGEITAAVKRDEAAKRTVYEVAVSRTIYSSLAAVNFIVNDNDGDGRKGWLQWEAGIGESKKPVLWTRIDLKK
ncbi:MAG: beta-galactosidase [Spirochaetes bacterium]|nr:beta-galactosidase [Spirochaetota bacterium]